MGIIVVCRGQNQAGDRSDGWGDEVGGEFCDRIS